MPIEIDPKKIISSEENAWLSQGTHEILHYNGKKYYILKGCLYYANLDKENDFNNPQNRGSREVFLAKSTDTADNHIYIVKKVHVPSEYSNTAEIIAANAKEMALTHQFLNAPHVKNVIINTAQGTDIYSLQYFKGISLENALCLPDDYPMSPLQKINIAIEIITCVKNLHRQGFLHCDIKTNNIVIHLNPATGLYDVSLVDYGDAAKFDHQTCNENLHDPKYSIFLDLKMTLFTIILPLFSPYAPLERNADIRPERTREEIACENIIDAATSLVSHIKPVTTGTLLDTNHSFTYENYEKITNEILADLKVEKASLEKALADKALVTAKEAIKDIVAKYKSYTQGCCGLFSIFNRKHGWLGAHRANQLKKACEAATDMEGIQRAFKQCFSAGCFSRSRTNDNSLIRYLLSNKTIVGTLGLNENENENMGNNDYSFWCNRGKTQAPDLQAELRTVSQNVMSKLSAGG